MTDSQTIPWKRIGVEAAAVVASILLAFAIDAWWTEKIERYRTDELLRALESEWAADLQRIDSHLTDYERVMDETVKLINAHRANPPSITADEAVDLIQGTRWSTYKASVAALNVLLDFGLDHVGDPNLRMAIASWPSELAEVIPEQEAVHELGLLRRRGELARIAEGLQKPWFESDGDSSYRWYGVEPKEMALAVIADAGVMRAYRHELNLLEQYQRQLRIIRESLAQNLNSLRNR